MTFPAKSDNCPRPNLCRSWSACLAETPLYTYDRLTGDVGYFDPFPDPYADGWPHAEANHAGCWGLALASLRARPRA